MMKGKKLSEYNYHSNDFITKESMMKRCDYGEDCPFMLHYYKGEEPPKYCDKHKKELENG